MEMFIPEIDELKNWKEKFETEHTMWKNELENEREKLIRDFRQQCLLEREYKDERQDT